MKRTKLDDRVLPVYTKGEEIFNMVTHIVGGAMGIAALVLCIIFCHDGYGLFSGIVYGISMILLYTMSAIYHGLSPKLKAKKVFQIMDHCSIFVLIAGTYTPVLLCSIREVDAKWAWILFAVIWIMTVIGIMLNAIDIKKYQTFSMICYLAMGWCIIFKFNLLPEDNLAVKALNGLDLMAEYDARTVNIGAHYQLWKDHINLIAELNNGKYFSGGIYFKIHLK